MKKWTKRNKQFVGAPTCLGAVQWDVTVDKGYCMDKMDDTDKYEVDANFQINEEARSHWVHRKADLRPMYKIQKNLNDFITTCEKALAETGEHNAKS